MGSIKDASKPKHVKSEMIGKPSQGIGSLAGRWLAEDLAAENSKPAVTPEEFAWRRFNNPERRKKMLKEAREAALAAARCEP